MKKNYFSNILVLIIICLFGFILKAQPTNVAASDGSFTTKVVITWNSTPGKYFQVFRNTQNNIATSVSISTWQSAMTFNDNTATIGTTYYYWVKLSTSSTGANPSGFSVGNSGYRAPSPPFSVTATEGGAGYLDKVTVTWSSTPGYYYRLFRAMTTNSAQAIAVTTSWGTSTSYNDVNVADGVMYYYWVKSSLSSNGDNPSAFSSSEVKGHSGFGRPWNIAATDGMNLNNSRVSWNGIWPVSFKVYRNTSNTPIGASLISGTGTLSSLFFDDNTAVPGTLYYYFVQSCDNIGQNQSPLYESDQGYRAVSPPGNVSATINLCDKIKITWATATVHAPANPVNYYRVYRGSSNNSSTAIALGSGWFTGNTFIDLTAPTNTNCYYWIKASAFSDGARPSIFNYNYASGFRPSCFDDTEERSEKIIEETDFAQFSVTPNPVVDIISLSFQVKQEQQINLLLLNQFGVPIRTLINDNLQPGEQNIQVPVDDLSSGIYFISGSINKEKFLQKLFISH